MPATTCYLGIETDIMPELAPTHGPDQRPDRLRDGLDRLLASRLLAVPAALLFCLGIAFTVVRIQRHYHTPVSGPSERFGLSDFHNAGYFPGLAFSRGENPYAPAYAESYPVNRELPPYSPALLWLALPYGLAPLPVADAMWVITNLLLTVVLAWVCLRYASLPRGWGALLLASALIFFSRSGHNNLVPGQWAAWMTLATIGAVSFARSRPNLAVACFALATLKPTFGLPLGILLLCAGYFRVAIVGGLVAAAAAGAALGWLLWHDPYAIAHMIGDSHRRHITDQWVDPTYAWLRLDTISLLARIWGTRTSGTAEALVMLVHLLPVGWLLWRHRSDPRDASGGVGDTTLPLILLTIPVCVYHMAYDALLTLPVLAALLAARPVAYARLGAGLRFAMMALLVIPQVNYVTTWPVLTALNIQPGLLRNILASINGTAILLALILLAWHVARQPRDLVLEERERIAPAT
jgi:hypothetical protein